MTDGRTAGSRRARCTVALLLALSGAALAQGGAAPMTNEDVVKLSKMGFGTEVVIAKIDQAAAVNFKLEVDDLSKLKAAGVPQTVISEMLKRSTAAPAAAAPPGPPPGYAPGNAPVFPGMGQVKLITQDRGPLELHAIGGSMSTTFAYVTTLMHANFPGQKADVRIHEAHPSLLVQSTNSPKGHFYLVSAEVDVKDDTRSVKMGNSRFFGVKNVGAPDSDNQIPYEVAQEGADMWRITPSKDMKPGEYGLWLSMGQMYDFGIDQ